MRNALPRHRRTRKTGKGPRWFDVYSKFSNRLPIASTLVVAGALATTFPERRTHAAEVPRSEVDLNLDGTWLSPLVIAEPVYQCATSVRVEGAAPDATVELVVQVGASQTSYTETSVNGGDVVFSIPSLPLNAFLLAKQELSGEESDLSQASVRPYADDYPIPLPAPNFEPSSLPLYECGRLAVVGGTVPGSSVQLYKYALGVPVPFDTQTSGSSGVAGFVAGPTDPELLSAGDVLTADFTVCPGETAEEVSPLAFDQEVQEPPGSIDPPTLEGVDPAAPGEPRAIHLAPDSLLPGAIVRIYANGNNVAEVIAAPPFETYFVSGVNEFDTVTVTQDLCGNESQTSTDLDAPADLEEATCGTLTAPKIVPPMVGDDRIFIRSAVGGARILVFANGTEIGDGGGSTVVLRRALLSGDEVVVMQVLGVCESSTVELVELACFSVEDTTPQAALFDVGVVSYDLDDEVELAPGVDVRMRADVAYPATADGSDTPIVRTAGKFPVVIVAHGNHGLFLGECQQGATQEECEEQRKNHTCSSASGLPVESYRGHEWLISYLAARGFIAVSIDAGGLSGCVVSNDPDVNIPLRAELMKEHLALWTMWDDPAKESIFNPSLPVPYPFTGKFSGLADTMSAGVIGHSRGSEGAVVVGRDCGEGDGCGFEIRAVAAYAPTDRGEDGNGQPLAKLEGTPYLVFVPSADGDVYYAGGTRAYNRASSGTPFIGGLGLVRPWTKTQIYMYDVIHNAFNDRWPDEWLYNDDHIGLGLSVPGQPSDEDLHQYVADVIQVFMRQNLRREPVGEVVANLRVLAGESRLASVPNQDAYFFTYEVQDAIEIDRFQDADPAHNDLGGTILDVGSPVTTGERPLSDPSLFEDVGSFGFTIGWQAQLAGSEWQFDDDGTGAVEVVQAPESYVVSLRVGRVADASLNNPHMGPLYLRAKMTDSLGNVGSVLAPSVPHHYLNYPTGAVQPFSNGETKTIPTTLRVPLLCFDPEPESGPLVLTNLASFAVESGPGFTTTGEVVVDDLTLSR